MLRARRAPLRRIFARPKIGTAHLAAACCAACLGFILALLTAASAPHPLHEAQLAASERMRRAELVLKEALAARGIPVETELDPNLTGLIGPEWTPLTTTLGTLEAKRTVLNPNFAALMVRYFHQAGLKAGDVVAVGASGSFPGLALATLCAAHEMGIAPLTIASFGSSMYGATRPGFTVPEMMRILADASVIPFSLVAVSPGGDGDNGENPLFDDSRGLIAGLAAQAGSGVEFIRFDPPDLEASIARRMKIYETRAGGKRIACFVNIGGASPNSGTSAYTLDFPQGLVMSPPRIPTSADRGLIYEYASRGLPVINLLNVRLLADQWGLPYDPVPLPRPGEGGVYRDARYSRPLILATLAAVLGILAAGVSLRRAKPGEKGELDGGANIHLAFRFHVNLYHSYRGDSLDEKGIGKDIRIIRALLDELDALQAAGVPVRAAWDIENCYSLELYLPRHAPDIVERIHKRVAAGLDEVEPMSFNNGLLCAHTGEEFEDAVALAIRNPGGSGIADIFGEWAPILRPQECMFSASRITACRRLGIEAVSLFYSAAPFNGFGSFVPPLNLERRHNPLCLVDPASGESIRLLPAYSPADVVDNWCSLRGWLRGMRREQLASGAPDLLLLIDMDADDSFWEGYLSGRAAAILRRFLPSLGGFGSLVRSVADLPWLRFTRPWDYLRTHGDSGEIRLGQDLADGSFDGYSSWSEKAENARLWPRVALARRLLSLARRVAAEKPTARGAGHAGGTGAAGSAGGTGAVEAVGGAGGTEGTGAVGSAGSAGDTGASGDTEDTGAAEGTEGTGAAGGTVGVDPPADPVSGTSIAGTCASGDSIPVTSPTGDSAFALARAKAEDAILRSLSTTHFGMASPVMNVDRLRDAFARAEEAVDAARSALDLAKDPRSAKADRALWFDERIDELPRGDGAIVTLPASGGAGSAGSGFPRWGAPDIEEKETWLVALDPETSRIGEREAHEFALARELAHALPSAPAHILPRAPAGAQTGSRSGSQSSPGGIVREGSLVLGEKSIGTKKFTLAAVPGGGIMLWSEGRAVFEKPLAGPWVRFAGGIRRGAGKEEIATRELVPGALVELRARGSFELESGAELRWTNTYTLASRLSSLRVDVEIEYPRTEHRGFDRAKALRLGRDWDARWKEVAPFELIPALGATRENPARVWKHGFDGVLSSYELDYHRFGPNRNLDSFDNHCTDGWVAVSGGGRGLLLAQSDSAQTLFAFCPMRLRFSGNRQIVGMNPFGSYYGKQWRYPTAVTGLGRFAALATGDNFDPYAPSWEGGSLRCSLMIAPYEGDCPPAGLRRDALVFATSPTWA